MSSLSGWVAELSEPNRKCLCFFSVADVPLAERLTGGGKKVSSENNQKKLQRPLLLTHITLLGEPMDEPGGEMEASDSRRCCRGAKR